MGKKKKKKKDVIEDAAVQALPIDDQLNLVVGTEFDFVIKAKAEEIDSQKLANNIKMDELIEKLGYFDYRDALACNRYIIEAKRSKDYH